MEEMNKNHPNDKDLELTKFTNKFIKKITNNLETFSYNIIIANLHEMYSFLIKEINKGFKKKTILENYKKILITINPIVPHLSNECLKIINESILIKGIQNVLIFLPLKINQKIEIIIPLSRISGAMITTSK